MSQVQWHDFGCYRLTASDRVECSDVPVTSHRFGSTVAPQACAVNQAIRARGQGGPHVVSNWNAAAVAHSDRRHRAEAAASVHWQRLSPPVLQQTLLDAAHL